MLPKIGLVTTANCRASILRSFLRYHLAVGISRIYLFWEGPETEPLLDQLPPQVTLSLRQPTTDVTRAILSRELHWIPQTEAALTHPLAQVVARQIVNGDRALRSAHADGLDWLIHLDSDEAICSPNKPLAEHFAEAQAEGIEQLLFVNHEGVAEDVDLEDWFLRVTLFKRSPSCLSPIELARLRDLLATGMPQLPPTFFHYYQNGKAAARALPHVKLRGVHAFEGVDRGLLSEWRTTPYVLHYSSCGYNNFVHKYQFCGSTADPWLAHDRCLTVAQVAHERAKLWSQYEDETLVRHLYERHFVFDNAAVAEILIRSGVLFRDRFVAQTLALDRVGTEQ